MSLTSKEIWVIEAIVSNSYCQNNYKLPCWTTPYEEAADDACWTDTIDDNGAKHGTPVQGKELSGVLSSLNKKGFVSSYSGREGTASVTKAGWEAYQDAMEEFMAPDRPFITKKESYTKNEFYDACTKIIGDELVQAILSIPTNQIPYLCEEVSKAMLLNTMKCSETDVLRVVQVTAYNLWKGDGNHGLR